jgi:D-glycero-D-manno-heptose 1,7-bisphosphate phosphatase
MRPAVFLDRDDTLNDANGLPPPPPPGNPGDVTDPALVRLLPGVQEGCRLLRRAGFTLVVVSNQGSVARGAATLQIVRSVNDKLRDLLPDTDRPGRSMIDAVYFCPFHPRGNLPEFTREHPWRKPAPGMILAAAADLDLDLSRSWLIGDAQRDIDAGIAAGLKPEHCLLVGPRGMEFAAAARAATTSRP